VNSSDCDQPTPHFPDRERISNTLQKIFVELRPGPHSQTACLVFQAPPAAWSQTVVPATLVVVEPTQRSVEHRRPELDVSFCKGPPNNNFTFWHPIFTPSSAAPKSQILEIAGYSSGLLNRPRPNLTQIRAPTLWSYC